MFYYAKSIGLGLLLRADRADQLCFNSVSQTSVPNTSLVIKTLLKLEINIQIPKLCCRSSRSRDWWHSKSQNL